MDRRVIKYPIIEIDTKNYTSDECPTVHCTDAITENSFEEMLQPAFSGSEASADHIQYFGKKCSDITEIFYLKSSSPGRLKSESHAPVRVKLRDKDAVWRCKSIPLGSKGLTAFEILLKTLSRGQLEFSNAVYGNPRFLIFDKDGKYRMLIDLRELNKHVELEGGHPQLITNQLTMGLRGHLFNTLIDVKD